MKKKFYFSKTFWGNIIAAAVLIVQGSLQEFVVPPEWQAGALTGINIVLRFLTNEELDWSL